MAGVANVPAVSPWRAAVGAGLAPAPARGLGGVDLGHGLSGIDLGHGLACRDLGGVLLGALGHGGGGGGEGREGGEENGELHFDWKVEWSCFCGCGWKMLIC